MKRSELFLEDCGIGGGGQFADGENPHLFRKRKNLPKEQRKSIEDLLIRRGRYWRCIDLAGIEESRRRDLCFIVKRHYPYKVSKEGFMILENTYPAFDLKHPKRFLLHTVRYERKTILPYEIGDKVCFSDPVELAYRILLFRGEIEAVDGVVYDL